MAQRTIIKMIDDLDGTEFSEDEGETVSFALDGQVYTVDLTNLNAKRFREVLAEYVEAGTRVSGSQTRKKARSGPSPSDVRAWAQGQGLDVSSQGRISHEIRDQYNAAH